MPWNTAGRNAALAGFADAAGYLSLHDEIPDGSGSGELSGGDYARQSVTWNTPGSGRVTNNGTITHPVPAGSTVVAYGHWSAAEDGTFYGWTALNGGTDGFGTVDSAGLPGNIIQSAAHGLSDGDCVYLRAVNGESLPENLTADTLYYVISSSTDTFALAETPDGVDIDITGQGELYWQRLIPETYGVDGTLLTSDGDLVWDLTGI